MPFQRLTVSDWRQFGLVDLEFHNQLTVITGANGTGKTTLLKLLARNMSWQFPEQGVPDDTQEALTYAVPTSREVPANHLLGASLGRLSFADGTTLEILAFGTNGVQYKVALAPDAGPRMPGPGLSESTHSEPGVFIRAGQGEYIYAEVKNIPLKPPSREEAFRSFDGRFRQGNPDGRQVGELKQTLIEWAVLGPGNEHIAPIPEYNRLWVLFHDVLRQLLPPEVGFRRLRIRSPEVIVETDSGEFLLDTVSAGMSSILDIAWQLFLFDPDATKPFVAIIDEPESHLHAALQRRLLPVLIQLFPNVQFVVATHSPFIASSRQDANVYILRFADPEGGGPKRVVSEKLDPLDWTGTASDVLRDVLGLQTTAPMWVEEKLRQIVERYSARIREPDAIPELYRELKEAGLEEFSPITVDALLEGMDETHD